MLLEKISATLNASVSFSKLRFVIANIALFVCLTFFLCFKSCSAEHLWLQTAFFYLPILFSGVVLFCFGIFIQTLYKNEQRFSAKISGKRIWIEATRKIVRTIHAPILPLFIFVFLWILFGIFIFLHQIVYIGFFFSFFITCTLLLMSLMVIGQVLVLFFVTPLEEKRSTVKKAFCRIYQNFTQNIIAIVLSIFPFIFITSLGVFSLRFFPVLENGTVLEKSFTFFFSALPVVFLQSFAIIFFFQFSLLFNRIDGVKN